MYKLFGFLYFVLFINASIVYSQKYDFKWLLGYSFADNPLDTGWGCSIMDFDTPDGNPVFYEEKYKKIDFHHTSANICDENGNYLFACNGAFVEDSSDQLMLNADLLGDDTKYPMLGLGLNQGALIIPFPAQKGKYILFHKNYEILPVISIRDFELFYSIIDMNANSGKGKVISRRNSLIRDTLDDGCLIAVKHANGRDWWVLLSESTEVGYYIFLVTNKGVNFIRKQVFDGIKVGGAFGQSFFSNDGNYFVTAIADDNTVVQNNNIYFFIFDRCEGILANFQYIKLPYQITYATGCSFSFDNQFLYVVTLDSLYKYSIANNSLIDRKIIAYYDGYQEQVTQQARTWTEFGMLQQASDGRIYGTGPGSPCRTMDVIDKPNLPGKSCNFIAHTVRCPTMKLCLPNFPNYRLGPIDGSICDTLGIDNIPWAHWRYDQDTTHYLKFEFTDLSAYEVEEWFWDFGDGGTSSDTNPVHTFSQNGIYEVCLIVKNKKGADTLCRTIKLGTVDSKDHPSVLIEMDVWPNPCKEVLIINVMDYNPQKMVAHLFNNLGEIIKTQRLKQGSNFLDMENLTAGIFILEISEKNKNLHSEKIIKVE